MPATAAKHTTSQKPVRNRLIARVHIMQVEMGLDEETYRGVIHRMTGQVSAGRCNEDQLRDVIDEFQRLRRGQVAQRAAAESRHRADHPMAKKARKLWMCLGHLCAIRDPAEATLEAMANRQLGCDRLQFARQSGGDRLIEALKAMAERHGWDQSPAGIKRENLVPVLRNRLSRTILRKLKRAGLVPSHWGLGEAMFRLCGLMDPHQTSFTDQEHDRIATALGRVLREEGGDGAFDEMEISREPWA